MGVVTTNYSPYQTHYYNYQPMTSPTYEQLKAIVALNDGLNQMEKQFPTFINGDQASDMVSDAITLLNLPETEEENMLEVFWRLCEEGGII